MFTFFSESTTMAMTSVIGNAALMKKAQAGDLEAIRLWNELSKENRDVGEGVQIIVEAPRK